jgi:hypothetical protein
VMSKISRVRSLMSLAAVFPAHQASLQRMCEDARCNMQRGCPPSGRPLHSHLVEESLAKVLHGPLKLIPLRLPLLVVPHILSCWALPGGGPGVLIHIVKPPSGVCAFFPARNIKLKINIVTKF